MTDWSKVRYFKSSEPWGDSSRINSGLVFLLDEFRHHLGLPFHVTFGTQGKHVAPWHELGLAVDGVVDCGTRDKLDVILMATRLPFHGVGVYPKARHPLCTNPLGFHFDVRGVAEGRAYSVSKRWLAVPGGTLINQHPFDAASLRRFGLV